MARPGQKKKSPSFQRYWSELRVIKNKTRNWRKSNPQATDEDVLTFIAGARKRWEDRRKR